MVVFSHSRMYVTVEVADSVKVLVSVGRVQAAVLPLSKSSLLQVLAAGASAQPPPYLPPPKAQPASVVPEAGAAEQPTTETKPVLFDPVFEHVDMAELRTV
jgi:hypothetical protein